ncbi:MFS transporter [bacterium]|nr:MFS transporter [bacterium]
MRRNYFVVFLILIIFLAISFLTNIIGALVPDMIKTFDLSLFFAGFLPFSFFIAYGVMSIPAGILVDRYKEKTIIITAFAIAFTGAFCFTLFPYFIVGLFSLFMIGIGMTMLQVAINPLLRVAGGEEHFAFTSVLAQLFFGAAGFIGPKVYSYIATGLPEYDGKGNFLFSALQNIVPPNATWISLYAISAVIALIMLILIIFVKLPKVKLKEDEKVATSLKTYAALLKDKYVISFFIAIFAYVGTEQGIADWSSKFLETYHNLDPKIQGADTVANFWLALTFGCFLGLALLKLYDSRKILIVSAILAIATLTAALLGSATVALYAFPAIGFFLSVMWSIIFSLALNSVKEHHGSFSGILCTGIIGGALLPPIIGLLGDLFGLRIGMLFLYITLGYILSIGFWAKPIINNSTISIAELLLFWKKDKTVGH